jgi:hypothetical protein
MVDVTRRRTRRVTTRAGERGIEVAKIVMSVVRMM